MNSIAGIDYGLGQSNIDKETGIRYGVISLNSVNPYWLDEFEAHYPELLDDEQLEFCDPESYTYEKDGLICEYHPNSSMNILWVFKSPVIVECKFCSPCVPGAGNLDNQVSGGIKTYGLPTDCLYTEE